MKTEHDDLDTIPPDILRVMQDLNQSWRRCRRKSCRRAHACRGVDVGCAIERVRPAPRNPDKAARDDARAMAIFQRMLHERLDELRSDEEQVAPQQTAAPRRRRY